MADEDEKFLAVERIYLRLGQAQDSDQLSTFCDKYLPELLEMLESSVNGRDTKTRDKILDMLTQLKRRLKANRETQLPMDFLLNEYKNSSALIKNFSYLFLKIGFTRLPLLSQMEYVPELMEAVVNKASDQQLGIWFQLLPVLRLCYVTARKKDKEATPSTLIDLTQFPAEFSAKFLNFCAEFLLLGEGSFAPRSEPATLPGAALFPPGFDDIEQRASSVQVPSGVPSSFYKALWEELKTPSLEYLSSASEERNRSGTTSLTETKVGIVRMLGKCRLASEEVAWLWALSSADSHHSVVHEAEMQLKQAPGAGVNHTKSMRKLYDCYLGTMKNQTIPEAERRAAVDIRTKLKLMTYYLRYADTAASVIPQSVQLLFENWFGADNDRLRLSGMEFASYVVPKLKERTAALFAPLIFANVRKLQRETNDIKLGSSCYVVLGKLGLLHSNYVFSGNKRVELIQDLFDDLSEIESDDVSAAAQSCLLDWLEGFTKVQDTCGGDDALLEAVLLAYADHKSAKCRLTALRFLGKLFSIDHAPSRFTLFLANDDPDEKVRREAAGIVRGAESDFDSDDGEGRSFEQACRFFYDKVTTIFERQDDGNQGTRIRVSGDTLKQMILYLRERLLSQVWQESNQSKMDVGNDTFMDELNEEEEEGMTALGDYFGLPHYVEQWWPYYQLLVLYLEKFGAGDGIVLNYVVEIVSLRPESSLREELLPSLVPAIPKLCDALQTSTSEVVIMRMAEILALVYSLTKTQAELKQEIDAVIQHMKTADYLSAANVYLHSLLCAGLDSGTTDSLRLQGEFAKSLCDCFRRSVSSWTAANVEISANGLKLLALKVSLIKALVDNDARRLVCSAVMEVVKSSKEAITSRHKERCVEFLGCWLTNEPTLSHWEDVLQELVKTAEGPPNISLQPAIGKSLVAYCLSPVGCSPYADTRSRYKRRAPYLRRRLSECLSSGDAQAMETERRIDWLLNFLLAGEEAERRMKNKNYKQACCMWIEVLLQTCGRRKFVQRHSERVQTFFISCLAEESDFTQDIAGRCLSTLFRCCRTSEQRLLLTKSLREQLTATSAKLTLLPYQELCSLCAVDCQKIELIYDLMVLALNQRSSRQAKQFANRLPLIVVNSVEKLKQFERILVPAFFRFTYDPNPSVKRVFQNIWASVSEGHRKSYASVPGKNNSAGPSLAEKYANEIFDHLLYNLESNQWRYREASCVSLNDLLNGSRIGPRALEQIGELWQRGLRVLDDMKESVALAAAKLVNSLSRFTIRMCSADGCPNTVLPIVVPRLVEFGLQSNAALVRLASLTTVITLIKESPPAFMKPYLGALMSSLLDALSWTESDKINYISVRADAEERERIDQARVAASKSSPVMDSLELCCRHVDEDILRSFVPKLIQTLQANVGFATKSGACRLAVMLRVQASSAVAPFADSLLKCFVRSMTDQNITLRKQAANALGHLAPLCGASTLKRLFASIQQWYLDVENPSLELSSLYALRSLASYAPDVLKDYGAQAAPIAFLAAQNEPDLAGQPVEQISDFEATKAMWDEVLAEITLSNHVFDIYDFCARLLCESPSWRLKALSAKTIGVLVGRMDSDLPYAKVWNVVSFLTKSLDGRTWDGKERIFQSLGATADQYRGILVNEMPEKEKLGLADVMLKESQKRSKPKYRNCAIAQTAAIADALSLQIWKRLHDLVAPDLYMEIDVDKDDETVASEFRYCSYVALARCLNTNEAQAHAGDVERLGSMLLGRLPTVIWREQIPILDAILAIFEKKLPQLVFDSVSVLDAMITVLDRARQSSIKQRCVAILRATCDNLVRNDAFIKSYKQSSSAQEVTRRFLENENVKTLARDLIDRMTAFWKH